MENEPFLIAPRSLVGRAWGLRFTRTHLPSLRGPYQPEAGLLAHAERGFRYRSNPEGVPVVPLSQTQGSEKRTSLNECSSWTEG